MIDLSKISKIMRSESNHAILQPRIIPEAQSSSIKYWQQNLLKIVASFWERKKERGKVGRKANQKMLLCSILNTP